MAKDMAVELKKLNIDCISVYPGVVRTERMIGIIDSGDWKKRSGLSTPLEYNESPIFTGRVIASLLLEEDRKNRNGKVTVIAEAARELGIKDISGITPPSIRSLKFLIPSIVYGKINNNDNIPNFLKYILNNIPDILLPMSFMEGGLPEEL